jgi:oligopeptide transport system substrate-binding protein
MKSWWLAALAAAGFAALAGCGRPPSRVQTGDRDQVLQWANLGEPQDLDPHTVSGVSEQHIIDSLFEGLVMSDPRDLHPVPGVAEKWEVSEDGRIYTFHLRPQARWSNGERVTARDFVRSYKRMLAPSLGSEYAYMLYVAKNAEDYNKGKITDFEQVGFKALDEGTLRVELNSPTPYFLSLLSHYSWFPVPVSTIEKYGPTDERGNTWTKPGHFVGNGPFALVEWKIYSVVAVRKSPTYWDAARVRLNGIRFYPIDSLDAEERAFRAGQLHLTYDVPLPKIDGYRRDHPNLLFLAPYLGTYIYRLNTTRPVLSDKRVRRALSMSVDRESIARQIMRGGEQAAYCFTPPNTAGYTCSSMVPYDIPAARKLLAEAGFPDGRGFPQFDILFNTLESHKAIAEAIQQMWKKNLNIDVRLASQEWKVYIDTQRSMKYDIARYGWIGDYVDPNSFLDMFLTGGGNNETGWSNPEYDHWIREAGKTADMKRRFECFQKAEAILLDESPIIPIYQYTRSYLLSPSVKGWYPNLLDVHPHKYIYLDPGEGAAMKAAP